MNEKLKIYCVFRGDLEMPLGKAVGQGGHAFSNLIEIVRETRPDLFSAYFHETDGRPKITVKAKNLHALQRAFEECKAAGLPVYWLIDLGHTVFEEPTATCFTVGPCLREQLPPFVQKLQLLDSSPNKISVKDLREKLASMADDAIVGFVEN